MRKNPSLADRLKSRFLPSQTGKRRRAYINLRPQRKRRFNPKRHTSARGLIQALLKLLIIALVLVFLNLIYQHFFLIRTISCKFSGSESCPQEVLAELEQLKGNNLLFLDSQTIQTKIESSNPSYSQAQLNLALPGHLSLTLERTDLVAQFSLSSQSGVLIVNNARQITDFQPSIQDNLPLIISTDSARLTVGSTLTGTDLVKVVDLAQALNQSFIPFHSLQSVSPFQILVRLDSNLKAVFDPNQDYSSQINRLKLILAQPEISTTGTLDVRFQKPVLDPLFQPPPATQ